MLVGYQEVEQVVLNDYLGDRVSWSSGGYFKMKDDCNRVVQINKPKRISGESI